MNGKQMPDAKAYSEMVDRLTPKSPKVKGFLRAFWVGGLICTLGQAIGALGGALGLSYQQLPMFSASVLVFLGTTLTGVGVYDKIGKYAGAGSVVPITGFANSVCAPAMEFRREGLVLGVGAKLFSIAGPVLSYGISASVIYGLIFWLTEVIG